MPNPFFHLSVLGSTEPAAKNGAGACGASRGAPGANRPYPYVVNSTSSKDASKNDPAESSEIANACELSAVLAFSLSRHFVDSDALDAALRASEQIARVDNAIFPFGVAARLTVGNGDCMPLHDHAVL